MLLAVRVTARTGQHDRSTPQGAAGMVAPGTDAALDAHARQFAGLGRSTCPQLLGGAQGGVQRGTDALDPSFQRLRG